MRRIAWAVVVAVAPVWLVFGVDILVRIGEEPVARCTLVLAGTAGVAVVGLLVVLCAIKGQDRLHLFLGRRLVARLGLALMVSAAVAAAVLADGDRVPSLRALVLPAVVAALTVAALVFSYVAGLGDERGDQELRVGIISLAGIVAALGTGVFAVVGAHDKWAAAGWSDDARSSVVLLGAVVALIAAAWHWSRRWFLSVAFVGTALLVAVLLPQGATQREHARLGEARATATSLYGDHEVLARDETADTKDAVDAAATARTEAAEALADALDTTRAAFAGACPTPAGNEAEEPAPVEVDQVLCRAMVVVLDATVDRGLLKSGDRRPGFHRIDRTAALAAARDDVSPLAELSEPSAVEQRRVQLVLAAIDAARSEWVDIDAVKALRQARTNMRALCTTARGVPKPIRPFRWPEPEELEPITCVERPDDERNAAAIVEDPAVASDRELDLAEALARRDFAAAAVGVDGTQARIDALESATATWEQAVRVEDQPTAVDVQLLVREAATDLVEGLPLTGNGDVPATLATLGWTLVLVGALLLLRRLARINLDRGSVSVKVEPVAGCPKDTDLTPTFKRHILSNAKEPAIVPGATTSIGVTEIFAKSDVASQMIGAIVAALERIFAVTASHTVAATYLAVPATGPKGKPRHEMFVQLRSNLTGEVVASHPVRAGTIEDVTREAGYWVAAQILSRDRTTPSWAAWSGAASRALAAADADEELGSGHELTSLRRAAADAPTSGIVLTRYANALDAAGKRVDALEVEIRSVLCHPRYPEARYRLMASLSMVAATVQKADLTSDPVRWRRIDDSLAQLCRLTSLDPELRLIRDDPEDFHGVRDRMLFLALRLQDSVATVAWTEHCLASALRRSERRYRLQYVLSGTGRRRGDSVRALVLSVDRAVLARQLVLSQGAATEEQRGRLSLRRKDSLLWWQIAYTDACLLSIAADSTVTIEGVHDHKGQNLPPSDYREPAVELLERARDLDARGFLTSPWVAIDPDLVHLRSMRRFQQLVEQLPGAEIPDEGADP